MIYFNTDFYDPKTGKTDKGLRKYNGFVGEENRVALDNTDNFIISTVYLRYNRTYKFETAIFSKITDSAEALFRFTDIKVAMEAHETIIDLIKNNVALDEIEKVLYGV